MKHLTIRQNNDGEERHYFYRRGVPLLRLFGDPSSPEFRAQYDRALEIPPQAEWRLAALRDMRRAMRKLRPATDESRKRLAASRLARSVNSRARHQYKVECEIDTKWVLERIEMQGGRCIVSGLPFSYTRGLPTKDRRNPYAPSVDRINCSIGYTKRNCRLVVLAVNIALNLWGDDLFFEVCEATCATRKVQRV